MARPDATALPQSGSRMGGLLDPARPSHRWWVATTVHGERLSGEHESNGRAGRTAPDHDGLWTQSRSSPMDHHRLRHCWSRAGAGGWLARQLARQPHVLPAGSVHLRDQLGPLCHLLEWPVTHHLSDPPGPWRQPHPAHDHDVHEQRVPARAAGHGHGVLWHGADRWSHCRYRHWGLSHGVPRLAHGLLPELCPWGDMYRAGAARPAQRARGGTARARPGRFTHHGHLSRQPPGGLEPGATGGLGCAVYPAAVCGGWRGVCDLHRL